MGKRETFKRLKKEEQRTKIERNLYLLSSVLFLITIIINILHIIYYPYLLNGLILEINILLLSICTYIIIKKQKKITELEDKKLELKIKYIIKNS